MDRRTSRFLSGDERRMISRIDNNSISKYARSNRLNLGYEFNVHRDMRRLLGRGSSTQI